MKSEYRKSPRRRLDFRLEVIDSMTESLAGEILDISAGGLKIRTLIPLPADALFQWRFLMPDSAQPELIECGIQVIWANPADADHYAVGVRFIQISQDMHERLRHWCSQISL